VALEPAFAALVTLVGIALTSFGAFTHTAQAMAPGAALALAAGAWLGNALARRRPSELGSAFKSESASGSEKN
jgi:hypothetical protein